MDKTVGGVHVALNTDIFELGITGIHSQFSYPLKEYDEPYRKNRPAGKQLKHAGLDYSFFIGNIDLFGELAFSDAENGAFLGGLLWSLHNNLDMVIVYRNYSSGYYSLISNPISEASWGAGETALYYNFNLKPIKYWLLSFYIDIFEFKNLRYNADFPTHGQDFLLQCSFRPNKSSRYTIRYKSETKYQNAKGSQLALKPMVENIKDKLRLDLRQQISEPLLFKIRMEISSIRSGAVSTGGRLMFQELKFKSSLKWSLSFRYSIFDIDAWESRIYAYEPDLPHSFSVPAYVGLGNKSNLVLAYHISRQISFWIKAAWERYKSSSDVVKRQQIKLMLRWRT